MLEVPVFDKTGRLLEKISVDESLLGGKVRPRLVKQALVMYHANLRQGNACTRSRGMVEGSTRKIYRQKGTGFARMGTVRTNIRRGGGVAFAKMPRDFRQKMPRKARRLARNSAILAKILSEDVLIIDELKFEQPKTRRFAEILKNLRIDRSCVVAVAERDENVLKSSRNVPTAHVCMVQELNAWLICNHQKLLFTRGAFGAILSESSAAKA